MDNIPFLIWYIPVAVICYLVSAFIHELGHVIVSLRYGWKLSLLIIGPIGIKRSENNKLNFYLEKRPIMWGGAAFATPVYECKDNLKIFSKSLLGGPIASIVAGCVFLLVCLFHFHLVWLLLGIMPLLMGIVCLLPMKNGFTYTDGKRWSRLRNGGQDEAEEVALWKLMERDIFKKDVSTLQLEDFEALLNAKLPEHRYYGHYYQYLYYSFQNDVENTKKALDVLQAMKKGVSKIVVDECKLDL